MSTGTLYRRAVRRVERRAATFNALRPIGYCIGENANHCDRCARAWTLLREAVVTANRLALCAGIA